VIFILPFILAKYCKTGETGRTGREGYSLRKQRILTFELSLVKLASSFETLRIFLIYISFHLPPSLLPHAEITKIHPRIHVV